MLINLKYLLAVLLNPLQHVSKVTTTDLGYPMNKKISPPTITKTNKQKNLSEKKSSGNRKKNSSQVTFSILISSKKQRFPTWCSDTPWNLRPRSGDPSVRSDSQCYHFPALRLRASHFTHPRLYLFIFQKYLYGLTIFI